MFDYQKICAGILQDLPSRHKEIIMRRFGLESGNPETLEAIGDSFGITRERVRQIERDALQKVKPKFAKHQNLFRHFEKNLETTGNLRKEDVLLSHLGGGQNKQSIFFLLTVAEPFHRFSETKESYSFWTLTPKIIEKVQKVHNFFRDKLEKTNKLLRLADFKGLAFIPSRFLEYFLEISKVVQKNQEGLFGLSHWAEINPRNIKDKSFLALKRAGKPLHFRDVAKHIGPDALPQTVHNELIRDARFVLVGRGLYALKEWGFKEGQVKDVIKDVLLSNGGSLSKDELLEKVLQQRLVKESTILLNLNNKKYFVKDSSQNYQIREA